MEASKLGEGILTETPHLTAAKYKRQHEDRMGLASEGLFEGEYAK